MSNNPISKIPALAALLRVGLAGALLASACDDGESATGSAENGTGEGGDTEALPEGCDFAVEPGPSGQDDLTTAFVEVQSGQTVCLASGQFDLTRQIGLTAGNVTIRGEGSEATVLDFSGQQSGGNGLLITGDGVTLEDLQVKNTPGDGIRANDVDGITFLRVTVAWDAAESKDNGAYGLYPVQSSNVVIRECLVRGARDAGIYVGQSNNVLVEDSEAVGNVAGIEIENTTDAIVRRNHAHDNTAGILVFNLPGLDVKDGKRANVYDNVIENNNITNFGDAGTVVGIVPPGMGILVLATDANEFWNNTIAGNRSTGLAVIAYLSDLGLFEPPNDPEFDIYAEGNYIHDNTWENNGNDPDGLVLVLNGMRNPSPTIIFDGCADAAKDNAGGRLDNCVANSGSATFLNADLCMQAGMQSEDIASVACTHPPLPTELPGLEDG